LAFELLGLSMKHRLNMFIEQKLRKNGDFVGNEQVNGIDS